MSRFILPFILLVAFLLRFIGLTDYPVGFNADEASFGYDAYSLLETGRDQWGEQFPLVLKSFGDYKSPLYSYLSIPFVKIFGLNVFAVRLPNVIIGTLAVLAVYLLSNHLYKKRIGVWAAIFLAVNPWSIMMSRGAFEANLITLFAPLGIYLFLKNKYVLSSIILGLGMFTYHSAKLIIPIIFLSLIIIFRKQLRVLLPALLTFAVFFSALIYTFTIGGGLRAAERSIFQGALLEGAETRIKIINDGGNPVVAKIFHNKYQVVIQRFISNYKQYFSPRFLLTGGAGEGSYGMVPGIGAIYFVEVLMMIGIVPLFRKEAKSRKLIAILFFWLLVAPLPAALASGVGYSGNRAMGMLPVIQILSGFGILGWSLIIKKPTTILVSILIVIHVSFFVKEYFTYPGTKTVGSMLYGNLETSDWLLDNRSEGEVIVSRSLSEPQIFLAFAGPWDPQNFQNETKNWQVETWVDQIPEYRLGNFVFKSIDWKKDTVSSQTIVTRPQEFPEGEIPDKIFYYPDGSPNIYVKTF